MEQLRIKTEEKREIKSCVFTGHRELGEDFSPKKLYEETEKLIKREKSFHVYKQYFNRRHLYFSLPIIYLLYFKIFMGTLKISHYFELAHFFYYDFQPKTNAYGPSHSVFICSLYSF